MADDPNKGATGATGATVAAAGTAGATAGPTGATGASAGSTGSTGATGATSTKQAIAETPRKFFAGYPKKMWHSHRGARTVTDPNEEAEVFRPAPEWHESAELADMHRDHNDAELAYGHNQHVKRSAAMDLANGRDPAPDVGEDAIRGPVRNSVAAQESLDAGKAEPL